MFVIIEELLKIAKDNDRLDVIWNKIAIKLLNGSHLAFVWGCWLDLKASSKIWKTVFCDTRSYTRYPNWVNKIVTGRGDMDYRPSKDRSWIFKNAESEHLIGWFLLNLTNDIGLFRNPGFWLGACTPRCLFHSNIQNLSSEGLQPI